MVYENIVRPILFQFDSETMHDILIKLGSSIEKYESLINKIQNYFEYENSRLNTTVFDIDFENPVGLAAGFDKNGEAINFLHSLGFGYIEIGSVTSLPCKGNKKPRMSRLIKERSLINKIGLDNKGINYLHRKIKDKNISFPIGINIAKTPNEKSTERGIEHIPYSLNKIYNYGDYFVINISCPNTNDKKTFENNENLEKLLKDINKKNYKKPILIKLAPYTDKLKEKIEICKNNNINGFVISNTLNSLSGELLKETATSLIKEIFLLTEGKYPIIGVGGIFSGIDAYEKIKAGASLIQIFTGLPYKGPYIVKNIKKELVYLLERDNYSNISKAVGTSV